MQIQADYRNSNANRYKNIYLSHTNKNDVSFEGLNIGRLFPRSKSSAIPEKAVREYTYQIAGFLGLKTEEIASRIKGLNNEGRDFLFRLSRKFSDINFGLEGSLKEDPMLVFDVLRNVEQPKGYHYNVLSNTSGSFGYISRIFSVAQDKKSMEFVLDFQDQILKRNPDCKNILIEMLNSPFKKQYAENIDNYKSYIILNKENPEAIKELDLLIKNNQYERRIYDTRLTIDRVFGSRRFASGEYLSRDNVEKYYSKEGIEFLDKFLNNCIFNKDLKLSEENEIEILEIFKSTNKKNLHTRMDFIDKFKYKLRRSENNDEISVMRKLFELMDSDKHAMKFVYKISTTTRVDFKSIRQLYDVIKELTPAKADIFSDNIFRIARKVDDEELIPTLKEQYNNPFFETKSSRYNMEQQIRYRFRQPESSFSKFKRTVLNKINEYRLAREEKQAAKQITPVNKEELIVEKPITHEVKPVEEKPQVAKPPVIEGKPIKKQEVQEKVESALPFELNTQKALPLQPQRITLPKPEQKSVVIQEATAEKQISEDLSKNTKSIPANSDFKSSDRSVWNLENYKQFSHLKTGKKPQVQKAKVIAKPQSQVKPKKSNIQQPVISAPQPFVWNTQTALPIKSSVVDSESKAIEHIISIPEQDSSIKLINTVKESPKARKLRLIGEVNNIISKKLGAKTVETQGEIYGKNATKMRLKMLPEIFNSIKETRQTDRAVGKLKSNSANKDAVELYRLINGSNRKYVKYLLEKRNVDGTRMFEVKDIIAMVEKANKRVAEMKKVNPDFKAKDAKAYFDHLYDSKIEQYGKVKRLK